LGRGSAGRVNTFQAMPEKRGADLLTLTDRAAETIRTLISQPGIPADTGLRMSLRDSESGTLTLSLEPPQPDDAVIEDGGARVFVQRDAAPMVEDRELDAQLDEQGRASFKLGVQSG
jgi:iron-sulfur cluster assembly protein